MPKPVRADRRELRLPAVAGGNPTVDIFFDEHRVWSTKLPSPSGPSGVRRITWPDALLPYLHGRSTITVRSSATGEELGRGEVPFGGPGRVAITDAQGRWLAMNKWNRLGQSFDGDESGVQDRVITAAAELAERMEQWGYPVYIVGGTLLGAMRSGDLLSHDDDIDFAFWCAESDPQRVALVTFELERQLDAAGYTVVRHSHAHLEVVFFTAEGSTDCYIDIFAGYHSEDGLYNQPFALRGELPAGRPAPDRNGRGPRGGPARPCRPGGLAQLRVRAELAGPGPVLPLRGLPGDASPLRQLVRGLQPAAGVLGEDLATGRQARRGGGGRLRRRRPLPPAAARARLRRRPRDAGTGARRSGSRPTATRCSAWTTASRRSGWPGRPSRTAWTTGSSTSTTDTACCSSRSSCIGQGHRPYFFARNVLHQMPALGRADLFVTLHGVLDAQTFLFATIDSTPVPLVAANPETWALGPTRLRREAKRWRLGMTVLGNRTRPTPFGDRTNVTALIWA